VQRAARALQRGRGRAQLGQQVGVQRRVAVEEFGPGDRLARRLAAVRVAVADGARDERGEAQVGRVADLPVGRGRAAHRSAHAVGCERGRAGCQHAFGKRAAQRVQRVHARPGARAGRAARRRNPQQLGHAGLQQRAAAGAARRLGQEQRDYCGRQAGGAAQDVVAALPGRGHAAEQLGQPAARQAVQRRRALVQQPARAPPRSRSPCTVASPQGCMRGGC